MISDVLWQAVEDLDHYLNETVYDDVYSGELRERILSIRSAMEDMRRELDGETRQTQIEEKDKTMNDEKDFSRQIEKLRDLQNRLGPLDEVLAVRQARMVVAVVIDFLETNPGKTWEVQELVEWIAMVMAGSVQLNTKG